LGEKEMSESGDNVEPIEPSKRSSDIAGPTGDEATVSMEMMNAKCYWNDAEYENGGRVNSEGKVYECTYGRWIHVEH
jgi:hypothetical protein